MIFSEDLVLECSNKKDSFQNILSQEELNNIGSERVAFLMMILQSSTVYQAMIGYKVTQELVVSNTGRVRCA